MTNSISSISILLHNIASIFVKDRVVSIRSYCLEMTSAINNREEFFWLFADIAITFYF